MSASTTRPRVEAALQAVDFPADRDVLVAAAEQAGDEQTARAVRAIPPVEYGGLGDVLASVAIVDEDHLQERAPSADGAGPSAP
jgi:uncharacterized protein DUF2795